MPAAGTHQYDMCDMLQLSGHILTPCRDYRPNDVLDAYEEEGIDEAPDMDDMTMEEQLAARRRAERELNKRDRRENRGGLPGALNGEHVIAQILIPACHAWVTLFTACNTCTGSDSDDSDQRPARRRRVEAAQADDMSEGQVCGCDAWYATQSLYVNLCPELVIDGMCHKDIIVNNACVLQFSMGRLDMPFEDIKGPISNWVTTKSIQEEIKRRFRAFLEAYKDEAEELVYKKRVRDMCVGEKPAWLRLLSTHRNMTQLLLLNPVSMQGNTYLMCLVHTGVQITVTGGLWHALRAGNSCRRPAAKPSCSSKCHNNQACCVLRTLNVVHGRSTAKSAGGSESPWCRGNGHYFVASVPAKNYYGASQ